MIKVNKINFIKHREQYHFFDEFASLAYSFDDKIICHTNKTNSNIKENEVLLINVFPNYFIPKFKNEKELLIKKIFQKGHSGYGIIIAKKTDNVDEFIKGYTSYSFVSNLNRLKNRLEHCFSINYKIFFGAILKDEFDFIIDSLINMQIERLNKKRVINEIKHKYDFFREVVLPKINNNEASLFVIYNHKTPIGIALNFHYNDKIFCGTIISFDTNYYKFGLGNLLIYKQLEWCFANNYDYMDLSHGDFYYKKKWSNHQYILNTYIICLNKNLLSNLTSYYLLTQIMLKNILKKLKFDKIIMMLNKFNIKLNNSKYFHTGYKLEKISSLPKSDNIKLLNIENIDYSKLKQPVFDFLYSKKEHIDNIEIYKINNIEDSFIFKGKNSLVKCNLKKA